MADTEPNGALPPPSEEIHLPEPSYLPALTALGITLAVVGVVLTWVITGIGVAIAVFAIVRWIRETREDMARLPLEQ
jgi:hypothetical protein